MDNVKVIYFFRGDLKSHVGLYKSWVDLVKDDFNITMLTFLTPDVYKDQIDLVAKYKKEGIKIHSVFEKFNRVAVFVYFLLLCIKYKHVVVHLRKQPIRIFKLLKAITRGRLKFFVDIEGDVESEISFLSSKKHSYKEGFYDQDIFHMKKNLNILSYELTNANGVFVTTNEMKNLFVQRYNLTNNAKFTVLPTACDKKNFYFDSKLRKEKRIELGFEGKTVIIFTGNVYYSWQNIKRSLQVYKLLVQKNKIKNGHFVILTREVDFPIVKEFAKSLGIESDEITLSNIPHNEVNSFLNASDIGILLRDDHQLNRIVSTGKMGEYLSTGLSIITSAYIGYYSKVMREEKIGIILDDIYSDKELLEKAKKLLLTNEERAKLSHFSISTFSIDRYKSDYINAIKMAVEISTQ